MSKILKHKEKCIKCGAERVFISSIGHMGRKSGIKEISQIIEIIKSNI